MSPLWLLMPRTLFDLFFIAALLFAFRRRVLSASLSTQPTGPELSDAHSPSSTKSAWNMVTVGS